MNKEVKDDEQTVFITDQLGGGLIWNMFKNKEGYRPVNFMNEADIVVFPGGPDIDPKLYGEECLKTTVISPHRTKRDLETWKRLQEPHYKDVLKVGICGGGQFLNVMNGGAMWQDVKNHAIRGTHGVLDILLSKNMVECTSTHHQMMIPNESKSPILMGAAWETNLDRPEEWLSASERKIPVHDTEILYYWDTHCYCFQPHPEIVEKDHECQILFFDHLEYVMKVFQESKEEKAS